MTRALIVVGGIVALLVAVLVVGYLLPVKHVAGVSAVLDCSTQRLWHRLTAIAEYPSWRRDIVQAVPTNDGHWEEIDKGGDSVTYEIVELVPQHRLVRRIADKDLPYGGSWTFELAELGPQQTRLDISEAGEVYNPIFRFVSSLIIGYHGTLSAFMEDLAKSEGSTAQIEKR